MKNVKKLTALLVVVCVVSSAGAALAYGRREPRPDFRPEFWGNEFEGKQFEGRQFERPFEPEMRGNFGKCGRHCRPFFEKEMPENIKSKIVELEKLRIDLRAILSSEKVDKAKALETFEAIQKLENEIKTWKFVTRLEKFEEIKRNQSKEETKRNQSELEPK